MLAAALAFLLGLVTFGNLSPRIPFEPSAPTSTGRFERRAIDSAPLARKADKKTQREIAAAYARLPLRFEANRGQTNSRVRFISRGSGYALFLTESEAVLSLRAVSRKANDVLRIKLEGGNADAEITGTDELPTKINYFIGSDPKGWLTNIPNYSRVKYENVYAGIDLIYYGNQGQLEYDFVISPGSDPKAIRLRFDGADKLRVDGRGDLALRMQSGEIQQPRPLIYQESNGERQIISGHYTIREDNTVGIEVGRYDAAKPLIIDPVLSYSTYLGGVVNNGNEEQGYGIAVDDAGCAYITGRAESSGFPSAGSIQPFGGGTADVFVTKLNSTGSALVYSTFLGGSGNDEGHAIALDSSGNVYITGLTNSTNYPTASAFQPVFGGGVGTAGDAFVTKLNATGNALVYSTYLGGGPFLTESADDRGEGIAVDSAGNAYVTGSTLSNNFPTLNCFQCARRGSTDAFVSKFDPSGGLVYSTYFGGTSDDRARGIAVDSAGNAYITGATVSINFPVANALQSALGGNFDAFVAKFNAAGTGLIFSTYLGGSGSENPTLVADTATAITLDAAGNIYLAGTTASTNFPTVNALQSALRGTSDAFISKLSPTGGVLLYSTYFGGTDTGGRVDQAYGIALDCVDNILITGLTTTRDFPTTAGAVRATYGGDSGDAFLVKINPSRSPASQLLYSTYLGGDNTDRGRSLAVDSDGAAYITGPTRSSNFPTANPFQSARAGVSDAFVSKIAFQSDLAITMTASPDPLVQNSNITYTITVTNNGPDAATKIVVTDDLPSVIGFVSCSSTGGGVCNGSGNNGTVSIDEIAAGSSATVTLVATTSCAVIGSLANTATVESCSFDPSIANNSATLSVAVADPPPVITCTSSITQPAPSNACSATVSFPDPTVTDNCPGATASCSPPSGAVFPVGATTVTCTATDSSGGTASCSFTVTVTDTQPPVISCPAGVTAQTGATCEAAVPDVTSSVTVSDNCGASSPVTMTQSPAAGAIVGLGAHAITVTATDAAGNSATCTTTLTVADATPPTITCPGAVTISADAGCQAAIPNLL
ncbi:MAG TPA: SBBP repeat-containing protein, partial [Blastocatellia bacterium]